MNDVDVKTAIDFLNCLQEGERWIELVEGRLIRLSPPDDVHGNVVRNLSKALGAFFRQQKKVYACFELGLIVQREPDTVRAPAISCYLVNRGTEEMDLLVSERPPQLIVEVASSNDRREGMADRIRSYRNWGVPGIWVFDPESQHAHVFHRGQAPRMLKETETLRGAEELAEFSLPVGPVFADPKWA